MATTNFTNGVTLTDAAWFNDTDAVVYEFLGDGTNPPTSKNTVRTNLAINGLTEDTSPNPNADYVETWDNSASASKKVLIGRIASPTTSASASLSGTSIDITNIPSWVNRIDIAFSALSTNNTADVIIQIGDSGGIETSSYSTHVSGMGVGVSTSSYTTGFGFGATAAQSFYGVISLYHVGSNQWVATVIAGESSSPATRIGGGAKTLSATLDRFRITTVAGTATFDAGVYSYQYS